MKDFKVNAVFFTYEKGRLDDDDCNIRYTRKHIGYYTERLTRNSNIEEIVHAVELPDNNFTSKLEVLNYLNAHTDHLNTYTDIVFDVVSKAVYHAHYKLQRQQALLDKKNALRGVV